MNIKEDIQNLQLALQQEGVILYPTDTVWGLGGDIHSTKVIERVFEIKNRPLEKKLVVLVDGVDMLKRYVRQIPNKALKMIEFYERPLTIIYDNLLEGLPPMLLGEDKSLAIRVVKDDFCQQLIAGFGKPILSTSANLSGEPFPTHYGEIPAAIKSKVDAIAHYRRDFVSPLPPSTIVKIIDGQDLIFIRK